VWGGELAAAWGGADAGRGGAVWGYRVGGRLGRAREEEPPREEEWKKIGKKKEKKLTCGPLIAYLGNMLFYNFSLRDLFYVINFSTFKHEFGELNSVFLVRVFTCSMLEMLLLSYYLLAESLN
jgi:hypothetical protein